MNAIVVGSGPNGLAAAITLAEAGWKVNVLEAQPTIGGGARSAELTLPGFIHDRCSAMLPLEAPASASFALVLGAAAHVVGWPFPEGGSQRISDALAAHLRTLGGAIETNRRVKTLDEFLSADAALLDLTAWQAARVAGS